MIIILFIDQINSGQCNYWMAYFIYSYEINTNVIHFATGTDNVLLLDFLVFKQCIR